MKTNGLFHLSLFGLASFPSAFISMPPMSQALCFAGKFTKLIKMGPLTLKKAKPNHGSQNSDVSKHT